MTKKHRMTTPMTRQTKKGIDKTTTDSLPAHDSYRMLYRDWLTLSTHLIWCYDHAVPSQPTNLSQDTKLDIGYTRAWLVRKGQVEVIMHDRKARAQPGEWLILNGKPQSRKIHPDTHLLSVAFVATWPDGTSLLDAGLPLVVPAADYPRLEQKLKKVARTMKVPENAYSIREQPMDYRTNLMLQRDFADWLLILLDVLLDHRIIPTGHYSYDTRVMQAMRLIDAQPLGKPLDLNHIAAVVGLSAIHLTRIFATELLLTPKAYFENRRIEHARRHLNVSDTQIKEIAYSLGFHDLSHFNKWFRKHTKCSPREYTRTAQSLP